MSEHNKRFFEAYFRHYGTSIDSRERLPSDSARLWRDRVPKCVKELPKETRILDAGCAQGHLLATFERVGFHNLWGVDISAPMIETARSLVSDKVSLRVADIREYLSDSPEGSFDVIFFHDVLEHIPRTVTVDILSNIHRVLSPGGILSIRVPNMANLLAGYNAHIDFTHVTQFAEYALLQVLEQAGFDAGKVQHESQAPVLFWSWRRPHHALLRVLNRIRWHVNNGLHRLVYKMSDIFPMPSIFDFNLLVIARK